MSRSNSLILQDTLTDREKEILFLIREGKTNQEIAGNLHLTHGTVKWYASQIYSKLGVSNRAEAVTYAYELDQWETRANDNTTPPDHRLGSLPAQLTSFIGRKEEIRTLTQLLKEGRRLITLTGSPGAGKTRLALETATTLKDSYRDGVYFVPLAPIPDPDLIPSAIVQILNIPEAGGTSALEALIQYLDNKRMLLVLDNYEHLLSGAQLVSELLKTSGNLTILVTSREALRLYGEYEYPVPPLQLPDLKQPLTIESLALYEAFGLLIQRTRSVAPNFVLDEDNAQAMAMICLHLDGLPLAIELAAARMRFYAPQTLLIKLGSRLETLRDGPRDLPDRQRTLHATLTWSYDLLTEEEQVLFARIGVFVGGCTQEAIEAICGVDLEISIAGGLDSLYLKNLIQQEHLPDGERRFTMLETMREFALQKLQERNELPTLRKQHAEYFRDLARQAQDAYRSSDQAQLLNWFEAEHDNLRSVIEWSLVHDTSGQMSFELIANLSQLWSLKSYLTEGRNLFEKALKLTGADQPTQNHAEALRSIGHMAYVQCDYVAAHELYSDALTMYRELNDDLGAAYTTMRLGEVATETGDYDTALKLLTDAYETMQRFNDTRGCADALIELGWGELRIGHLKQAQAHLENARRLYQAIDDTVGIAFANSGLGEIAVRKGEYDTATQYLETSLRLRRELGHKWGIAVSIGSLAWIAIGQNQIERAIELLRESLLIRHEIGDRGGLAWCLEKLGEISARQQNAGRAVRILGASYAIRQSIRSKIDPADQSNYEQLIQQLKLELGDDVFDALWSEGQDMSMEQIIQYADI